MDNLQTDISNLPYEALVVYPSVKFLKEIRKDNFMDYSISTFIRKMADDGNYYYWQVYRVHRVSKLELYKSEIANINSNYESLLISNLYNKFNFDCVQVTMFGKLTTEMLNMESSPGVKTFKKCVDQQNERNRLRNLMS